MSVRRCILILFAVAFLGISESYSMVDDPEIEADMILLDKDDVSIVIPVRGSGYKSTSWQPTLTYPSTTGKTGSEEVLAVGLFKEPNLQDQLPGKWSSGILDKTGRMRRKISNSVGSQKSPSGKALLEKEVPSFVGNSKTSCLLPENGLMTAEIRCKLTPTFKTCKSYCVFGSTYEEGIVRTSQCNYLDNRWSREFDECQPFIDCHLKMISPGSLKCITNEVENPPSCEVECQIYEENDPIPRQNFTCNIDGSWDPYLPHCVEPRGNRIMANPPADPGHGDILYP